MPIDHPDGSGWGIHEVEVSTGRFALVVDIVVYVLETPDLEQPYTTLDVKGGEYTHIREILDCRPTNTEPAMCSVM